MMPSSLPSMVTGEERRPRSLTKRKNLPTMMKPTSVRRPKIGISSHRTMMPSSLPSMVTGSNLMTGKLTMNLRTRVARLVVLLRAATAGHGNPAAKKGGRVEISKLDAEEKAQEVLLRMETAAREDREFYLAKKPAIHKIKLLDWAVARLRNRLYQAAFLEFNLCGVLEQWLQPLPDKSLCNSTIRRKIYAVLGTLQIEQQHLVNC